MPVKRSLPVIQDDNPQVSETYRNFSSIASNVSGDLLNFTFDVRTDNGQPNVYLRKLAGYAAVGNDAGAYNSLALGHYYKSNGTKKQFTVFDGASNSDIYELISGTWTAASQTLTAGADGYFKQMLDVLYYTNGTDAIRKYSTSWASIAVGEPYSGGTTLVAKYIEEYNNMLILANTGAHPYRLWISNVGAPETATTTFDFPEAITGVSKIGSYLVVMTESGIWTMIGSAPTNFTRQQKVKEYGCLSHRSIAQVENGGAKELWFVASDNSIRAFNGETTRRVGWNYVMNFWPSIAKGSISKCAGAFYQGRYHLAVPFGAVTANNKVFACDPRFEVWIRYDNWAAQSLDTFLSSGEEYLYFGESSLDSRVWQYPSGFTTQKPSASTAVTMQFVTSNLDGGQPFLIKKFKKLYAQLKVIGNGNMLVEANIDELGYSTLKFGVNSSTYINMAGNAPLWGSVVWGAFTWGSSAYVPSPENRGRMAQKGKIIKYRFTDAQTVGLSEIYYFSVWFIPIKVK